MKNIRFFLSEIVQFLEVKFSIYLNRRVFVMPNDIQQMGNGEKVFTIAYIELLPDELKHEGSEFRPN